jgi:hypothetical protein
MCEDPSSMFVRGVIISQIQERPSLTNMSSKIHREHYKVLEMADQAHKSTLLSLWASGMACWTQAWNDHTGQGVTVNNNWLRHKRQMQGNMN